MDTFRLWRNGILWGGDLQGRDLQGRDLAMAETTQKHLGTRANAGEAAGTSAGASAGASAGVGTGLRSRDASTPCTGRNSESGKYRRSQLGSTFDQYNHLHRIAPMGRPYTDQVGLAAATVERAEAGPVQGRAQCQ